MTLPLMSLEKLHTTKYSSPSRALPSEVTIAHLEQYPVVVYDDGEIISGIELVEAARQLGMQEIPVKMIRTL